jgi:hypothetical protein
MSFLKVQCLLIIIHYLTSCYYLACLTDFAYEFPDFPVPDKLTIFYLIKNLHVCIMALQSNADLRLLNGLLPVTSNRSDCSEAIS